MLSIQDGIKEIYSNPKKFYFFTGPEYGVKCLYIDYLKTKYNFNIEEYESTIDLLNVLNKKSLIPRNNILYIVRYDKSFISQISNYSDKLKSSNIEGMIILIYQDNSDEEKLDKYFPDNVLRINLLTKEIAKKHLVKSFEGLSEIYIESVLKLNFDFYKSYNICYALNCIPSNVLNSMSFLDISTIFGSQSIQNNIKINFAAKNFKELVYEIDNNDYNLNIVLYDILNVCLDIIKCLEKPYTESYVTPYIKLWSFESATNMFNEIYSQLEKLRNFSNYNYYNSLIYIFSLLNFKLG